MEAVEKLYDYLKLQIPISADYESLSNLCFSLFCTTDVLPENLKSLKITKEVLAITFMRISSEKAVIDYSSKNHWLDLIDKSVKINKIPNLERARTILGTL